MAIEEWQVSRIKDVKNEIGHYIKDISRIDAISLTLSKAVEMYDGKCWNKKNRKENLEDVVSKYNKSLDDAIHLANSLQSETCSSIREAGLFHSPIPRLF